MEHTETCTDKKMEWRRAWTALRAIIADPKRTDLAFEIVDALSGNSGERAFQRFLAHPGSPRLLAERPSLLDTLSDRAALEAQPPGSFGRAYADFMRAGSLTAEGLVEARNMAEEHRPTPRPTVDADRQFFFDRLRDMHDLWHVLTGYGMDEAGEAANLAFSAGQVSNPGLVLMVVAAALIGPPDLRLTWPRYLFRAWRRGRQASLLSAADYERLLERPLEQVRAELGIRPASEVHPEGIVVANSFDLQQSAA